MFSCKYKIYTPYMKAIFIVAMLLFAGLGVGLAIGHVAIGLRFSAPFIAFIILAILALEAVAHRYIFKYGIFTALNDTERKK